MSELRITAVALDGDEVVLEPLTAADAPELAPLLDDPGLHRFIGGEPLAADALADRYRGLERGAPAGSGEAWLNWVVRRRGDGAAVGTAQATVAGGEARLAWVIAGRWQGRGYAGDAAVTLVGWADEHRLAPVAHIARDHRASERVAARAGLGPTGGLAGGERVWRRAATDDARRR